MRTTRQIATTENLSMRGSNPTLSWGRGRGEGGRFQTNFPMSDKTNPQPLTQPNAGTTSPSPGGEGRGEGGRKKPNSFPAHRPGVFRQWTRRTFLQFLKN